MYNVSPDGCSPLQLRVEGATLVWGWGQCLHAVRSWLDVHLGGGGADPMGWGGADPMGWGGTNPMGGRLPPLLVPKTHLKCSIYSEISACNVIVVTIEENNLGLSYL